MINIISNIIKFSKIMKALFDNNSNLVGWISDDRKNIFDLNLDWVGFVSSDDSVWTVKSKIWIGNLHGYNLRDINGKTAFWNPESPIQNSLKPLKPLNPLTPLRPLKPLKPLQPLQPLNPLLPLGGWSSMSWQDFYK